MVTKTVFKFYWSKQNTSNNTNEKFTIRRCYYLKFMIQWNYYLYLRFEENKFKMTTLPSILGTVHNLKWFYTIRFRKLTKKFSMSVISLHELTYTYNLYIIMYTIILIYPFFLHWSVGDFLLLSYFYFLCVVVDSDTTIILWAS